MSWVLIVVVSMYFSEAGDSVSFERFPTQESCEVAAKYTKEIYGERITYGRVLTKCVQDGAK